MAVLAVIAGVAMAGTAYYAVFFAQGTAYVVRAELYEKIQEYSFANFDQFRTGNLLVRLNADVLNIANAIMYGVILILYAPFMILVAMVMAYLRTPSLAWIIIVVTAGGADHHGLPGPKIFKAYDQRQKRLDDLNNTLQENLSGARVVKAFVRENLENERFEKRAAAMRAPAYQAAFRVALLNPLLAAIAQVAIVFAIWIGADQIFSGAGLTSGELVSFMQYLSLVVAPLAGLAIVVPFLLRGDASAEPCL